MGDAGWRESCRLSKFVKIVNDSICFGSVVAIYFYQKVGGMKTQHFRWIYALYAAEWNKRGGYAKAKNAAFLRFGRDREIRRGGAYFRKQRFPDKGREQDVI